MNSLPSSHFVSCGLGKQPSLSVNSLPDCSHCPGCNEQINKQTNV